MKLLKGFILIGALLTLLLVYLTYSEKTNESHEIKENPAENEAIKKLEERYRISYGNENAPVKIIEFFSFQCPHCVRLFRDDFIEIKKELIDTGKVYFQFHPFPNDLATVQAMICFEKLEEHEKRLFLEAMFEEAEPSDQELMTKLMVAAMSVFKKPIPQLEDRSFLQNQVAFEEIYSFLQQEKISAVPTVEINGHLFPKEVPSYQFIKTFIKGL